MKTIKKRNYYYRIARKYGRPEDYDRYKCLRNDVVSSLRRSKAKLFNTLNPNLSKSFWTAIPYAKKKQSFIPTLVSNNQKFESDEEKVQVLNDQFSTNFNCSLPPLNPINFSVPQSLLYPNELLCTEIEVYNLISSIDMTKSNGPDGISAKMLQATVRSTTPAVTKLFNMLNQVNYQMNGNLHLLLQYLNLAINLTLLITIQYPYYLFLVNYWKNTYIHIHLLKHLQEQSGISNSQWGFTKGKFTTGALLTAVQTWHQILENGGGVCAIFSI